MIEIIFIILYIGIAAITYSSVTRGKDNVDTVDVVKSIGWPVYAIKDYLNKINKRD